jgi:SAM-dependent methyltransferase
MTYDDSRGRDEPVAAPSSVKSAQAAVSGSACKICGNRAGNKEHVVSEMMFGLKEEFPYLECGECGCLQLETAPPEMGTYYPQNYYAFRSSSRRTWVKELLRQLKNRCYFGRVSPLARFWDVRHPHLQLRAFSSMKPSRVAKILDVGCGSGAFVRDLFSLGFSNVLGIDPFIAGDIEASGRVIVRKCGLDELTGTTWDVIMFHHSFEHIPDPHETLRTVRNLLAPDGQCLIRVPVVSWAWRHYGANWVQLDAPRHFFLHSERSLRALAEQSGLVVTRTDYDSTEFQFCGSELYARGIAFGSTEPAAFIPRRAVAAFRAQALRLNKQRLGDQAAFYLAVS